ncbi:MAG: glycosyltransferase family 2 protein [Alphaproteobacteria bacterium]
MCWCVCYISPHIRRTALEQVSGWDAYNVTEDADLSFRFAAHGWQLGYITPPTEEEAVSNLKQWNHQRNRWMKGYMQTWITHMKQPLRPGGTQGLARFFTLQITVGVTLIAGLFHVPAIALLICTCLYKGLHGQQIFPLNLFSGSLLLSYVAGILVGAMGAARLRRLDLIVSTLWMPLYWLMLLVPTGAALIDLKLRPFHWNKTDHGDIDAAEPPLSAKNQVDRNVSAT